jgi:hypothetical protein
MALKRPNRPILPVSTMHVLCAVVIGIWMSIDEHVVLIAIDDSVGLLRHILTQYIVPIYD